MTNGIEETNLESSEETKRIYNEPEIKVINSVKATGTNVFNSKSYKITLTGNEINYDIHTEKLENGNIKIKVISPNLNDFDEFEERDSLKLVEKETVFNSRKQYLETLEQDVYEEKEDGSFEIKKDENDEPIKELAYEEVNCVRKEVIVYDRLSTSKGEIDRKLEKDKYVYEFGVNPKEDKSFNFGLESGWGDLNNDLVSYYKLDETSGKTAVDSHGLSIGTANNERVFTSEVAGIINTGADFTEADNINLGFSPTTNSAFTWTMWIKVNGNPAGTKAFASSSSDSAQNTNGVHMLLTKDGEFRVSSGGGTGNRALGNTGNITNNVWRMITLTYDGSTTGRMYIGGSISLTNSSWTPYSSTQNLDLARAQGNSDLGVVGYIDEVGIWNRTLTEDEISDLYNGGYGLPYGYERAVTEKPKVTGGRIRKRNYDIFINIPEIKAEMTIQPRIREVELLENHLKQNKRIVL